MYLNRLYGKIITVLNYVIDEDNVKHINKHKTYVEKLKTN